MIKLRGIPSAAAEMMLNIHNDVFDAAQTLLRENNFVIFEEALVRAGKLERIVRISNGLRCGRNSNPHFQCDVMNISCATFREGVNSKFDPLPTLAHVKEFLRKGNGNETTAGFGFVHWKREVTERKISLAGIRLPDRKSTTTCKWQWSRRFRSNNRQRRRSVTLDDLVHKQLVATAELACAAVAAAFAGHG